MPVTYTITAADVASVDPGSALTEGVVFNWDTEIITAPNTVNFVTAQWLVDHARFAAATVPGIARPSIVSGEGKYQTGVDENGLPELEEVNAILLRNWRIATAKTAGSFTVGNVFRPDGSYPIVNNPAVEIRYSVSRRGTLLQSGTGPLTPDQAAIVANLGTMIELGPNGADQQFTQAALWQVLRQLVANEARDLIANTFQKTVPTSAAALETPGTVVLDKTVTGDIDADQLGLTE